MSNVLVEEISLKNIANSIRNKNGLTSTYTPSQMASAISAFTPEGYTIEDVLIKNVGGEVSGSVSSISSYAFIGYSSITAASFPNCTSIGTSAFYSCTKLRTISFPNCTYIETFAFGYCSSLTAASFSKCTSTGNSTFYGCRSLSQVDFPNCTSIGMFAFANCSSLTSVNIPNCTSISGSAFSGCGKLSSVSFPNCTSVGYMTFYQCSSLATAMLSKVSSITYGMFWNCYALQNISFPICSYVSDYAFLACSALTSIDFSLCTVVGGSAFQQCRNISIINVPLCSSIKSNAFRSCYHLLSLYLNGVSSVTSLGTSAFYSTPIEGYTASTGGVYGSVFVPASLLTSFQTATNWASVADRIVGVGTSITINLTNPLYGEYFESFTIYDHTGLDIYDYSFTDALATIDSPTGSVTFTIPSTVTEIIAVATTTGMNPAMGSVTVSGGASLLDKQYDLAIFSITGDAVITIDEIDWDDD